MARLVRFPLNTPWIPTQDKQVFDLNGFSAVLSVSSDENPTTADYEFQWNAVVDATEDLLVFPFAIGDVDLVGDYYYDIQLTDGAGKLSTIRKGKMFFLQDISK